MPVDLRSSGTHTMKALADYLIKTSTTQTEFAQRMGVSQATISDLIRGEVGASDELIVRISLATGLSLEELLAEVIDAVAHKEAPAAARTKRRRAS